MDIDWVGLLPAAVLVSLVPGANQVLSIQHGAMYGVRSALLGLVGRFAAFGIHVALVAIGFSALLLRSVAAFEVIRWLGITYLLWLGLSAFRRQGELPRGDRSGGARPVGREFVTALTNPKALLLFAAFVPQFVASRSATSLMIAGAAYVAVEAVTATIYVLMGRSIAGFLQTPGNRRRLDRASGIAYLGMAGWVAVERRP